MYGVSINFGRVAGSAMFGNFFRKRRETNRNVDITQEYTLHGSNNIEVMVLKFCGNHGIGSRGNEDSNYIHNVIFDKWDYTKKETTYVIVDLENFSYSWGNSITKNFHFNDYENIHVVFVLGNKCSKGLKELCEAFGIDMNNLFFETVDAAMENLSKI